jgi:hypothetical protein
MEKDKLQLKLPKPLTPSPADSYDNLWRIRMVWGKAMLERIELDDSLADWRLSRRTSVRHRHSTRQDQDKLKFLTTRFRNALKKSVERIIELAVC